MKGITNAQKDVSDLATKGELAQKADKTALDAVEDKVCTQGVYSEDEVSGKGKIEFKNADNVTLFTVTGISEGSSSSTANVAVTLEDKKSGVTVTATPAVGTAKTAVSNSSGVTVFTSLAQGDWTFSASGYASRNESLIGGFQTTITLNSIIYGFRIAVDDPSPSARVSYPQTLFDKTNGAYGKTPASGNNGDCMKGWAECELISGIKRQVGSGSTYTDVLDKRSTVQGSSSENVMTYIPTWYMKMTNDGTNIDCAFSRTQIDDTWKDYAGSIGPNRIGHFRVGCYACKSDFKSYAGRPKVDTSISNFIAGCKALGTGYDIMTWYQWTYLIALAVLLYKSTNLQEAMAQGYVNGSSVQYESGIYFTNDYGIAGTKSSGNSQMTFFWIQNLWGNIYQFVGGAKTDSSYKLMTSTGYSSVNDSDFDKKSLGGPSSSLNGYISKVVGTTDAGFFPAECSGAATTYFADDGRVYTSSFPRVGGYYDNGAYAGPFFAYFAYSATDTYTNIGSRLSYRL